MESSLKHWHSEPAFNEKTRILHFSDVFSRRLEDPSGTENPSVSFPDSLCESGDFETFLKFPVLEFKEAVGRRFLRFLQK